MSEYFSLTKISSAKSKMREWKPSIRLRPTRAHENLKKATEKTRVKDFEIQFQITFMISS